MTTLQIVGRKNSGKTGLVVRLLPLLKARGLRVGTVKHSSHSHALDREGSDSARHREAGSEATMVITSSGVALHFPLPGEPSAVDALIKRFQGDLDLVLIEGWKNRRGPKIEVVPPNRDGKPRDPVHLESGELIGVVHSPGLNAAIGPAMGIPRFAWEDMEGIGALVLEWFGHM
ncbi:molybdopterin-guanine dinucleotide biosynthesis protein B [Candidatus Eisenbacteria bacterium]|uniref:Molybdopterin-guanine dinucleotide biosynthesis protein B n=1 Tax=Eiseniibacteriota bacterium TaxID=2212470 RepID=A0ABV6YI18_UNCEI